MSAPWIARIGPLVNAVNPRVGSFVFEIAPPEVELDPDRDDPCEYLPRLVDHPLSVDGDTVLVSITQAGRIAAWGGDFMDERMSQLRGQWAERLGNADAWRVTVKPAVQIVPIYWAEEEQRRAPVPFEVDGMDAS